MGDIDLSRVVIIDGSYVGGELLPGEYGSLDVTIPWGEWIFADGATIEADYRVLPTKTAAYLAAYSVTPAEPAEDAEAASWGFLGDVHLTGLTEGATGTLMLTVGPGIEDWDTTVEDNPFPLIDSTDVAITALRIDSLFIPFEETRTGIGIRFALSVRTSGALPVDVSEVVPYRGVAVSVGEES